MMTTDPNLIRDMIALISQKVDPSIKLPSANELTFRGSGFGQILPTIDSLLEFADKQVDLINAPTHPVPQVALRDPDSKMKVDNSMMKPQNAWIQTIDNSYAPFIPVVTEKPNALKPFDQRITAA
jgi:hypothetical protein